MGSIIIFSLFALFFIVLKIAGTIEDKKRQKAFLAAKEEFSVFYRENDLRTLTNMPDIYVVSEDDYPREKTIPPGYCYGKTIDVYITRTGEVYHSLGCPHASHAHACNVFKDYYTFCLYAHRPCSYCKPSPLPDVKWYNQYVSHLNTCRTYGITPRREP